MMISVMPSKEEKLNIPSRQGLLVVAEPIVAKAILGSRELAHILAQNQVLNYVEAHDNYNLYDLLRPFIQITVQIRLCQVETATAMS